MIVEMKITFSGCEPAVQENFDAVLGIIDATILDSCDISISTKSHEEV